MWLYGKCEKYAFLCGIWSPKGNFPSKITDFFGFLNFKAPKVPLLTRMRVYSEKQKGRFLIELQLCFSEYARILVSKGTFGALKIKNRNFRAKFW